MRCLLEGVAVWLPEDSVCVVDPPDCMVAEEPRLSMHLPPFWPSPGMLSELASIVLPLLLECPHT